MNSRPKFFQNCPVCRAKTPPGSINCPSCGVDLEIARDNQLNTPKLWSDFSYLAFGFITNIVISLSLGVLMYWYLEFGFLLYLLYGIFLTAMSAIGRYGRVSFYGYINLMILSMIPIINWAVVYYFGRGMHLSFTKQELTNPPVATSFWAKVLAIGLVVAYIVFLVDTSNTTSAPIPTAIPRAAAPPASTRTPLVAKTQTPNTSMRLAFPECYNWSEITLAMDGQDVCVYGIVYDLYSTDQVSTRIRFTSQPNSFFIFDTYYIYPDVQPGWCIFVSGKVEQIQHIPFVKIVEGISGGMPPNPSDCK